MKKIIFLLAVSVCCFQVAGLSQVRVGVTGGVSAASMESPNEGDGRAGFMAALVLNTPIKKSKFSFHPVLAYVQKGQTDPHPPGTLIDKQYLALRYMELAADVLYDLGGSKGGSFFVGAGPSVAFNLPSKRVSITDDVKTNSIIKFGRVAGINEMRGFDYGVDIKAGFRTGKGFLFTLSYNKGLRNLQTEGTPGTINNNYFGVQLGVFLNNGKPAN